MPTTSSHSLPYPNSTDPADVPADIAALAEAVDGKLDAIAPGQITGPTSGQILIANASGVITGTSVTGDVTISNSGVTAIGAGAVGTTELDDDAVTTAKIDDGAVTNAKIAASTTATPTFSNGASNQSTLTARKYADGRVLLSGSIYKIVGDGLSVSVVYATLPVGYRPAAEVRAPVISSLSGAPVFGCIIATNGQIVFSPNAYGVIGFLDGITFHAA